jgi:FAD/FMN-containing dehydrogenase
LTAGSVSDLVADLTYILPGQAECSRVPPPLLGAYASSLGRLGVVCSVSLRTIPISWLKQTTSNAPRETFVTELRDVVTRCDLLKLFWNPATDMCEIQEFVRLPDTENDAISLYPCKIENHFMVYQAQDLSEGINYAPELDTQFGVSKVPLSLKNTTGFGHCQKQTECPQSIPLMMDAEFCLPVEYLGEALTAIKAWLEEHKAKLSSDSIYMRFTGGDSLPWLSPVKGGGVYAWIIVSLDYKKMPDPSAAFRVLEADLWHKSKARPHLGKWNTAVGDRFVEMYGEHGKNFLELARHLQ